MAYSRRADDEYGIKGYRIAKFNALLDKPRIVSIIKTEKKNFLDEAARSKAFMPPPGHYETTRSLIKKNGFNLPKSKRITMAEEF